MRTVTSCLISLSLLAIAGCATTPYSPPAVPKSMTWNDVSKRDLYAATLRAVHESMEQIDPGGTNEDGNLIRTFPNSETWNDSMSVQTKIVYSLSFLVTESADDEVELLVNYHTKWWNNGWGDGWHATVSGHLHSEVRPAIDSIVASVQRQVGQPATRTDTYIRLGGKFE